MRKYVSALRGRAALWPDPGVSIDWTDPVGAGRHVSEPARRGLQPDTVAPVEINEHGQSVGGVVADWSPRPMPERVELTGHHVILEPIDPRHTDALHASLCRPGDESLWTYRPAPFPASRAELDEQVRVLAARTDSVTHAFVPALGAAAGLATFAPCVPASGVVEISGVLFGQGMQRTTAATEAIHLMLRHAFDDLGYRRVEWKCDSLNEPSRRAAVRFGFTYEGRFRQHMVTKGRNRDTDWFSILDAEWPEIRARHERWLDPSNFGFDGAQIQRLASI